MRRDKKKQRKNSGYNNKLSLFQKPEIRFKKNWYQVNIQEMLLDQIIAF